MQAFFIEDGFCVTIHIPGAKILFQQK